MTSPHNRAPAPARCRKCMPRQRRDAMVNTIAALRIRMARAIEGRANTGRSRRRQPDQQPDPVSRASVEKVPS